MLGLRLEWSLLDKFLGHGDPFLFKRSLHGKTERQVSDLGYRPVVSRKYICISIERDLLSLRLKDANARAKTKRSRSTRHFACKQRQSR